MRPRHPLRPQGQRRGDEASWVLPGGHAVHGLADDGVRPPSALRLWGLVRFAVCVPSSPTLTPAFWHPCGLTSEHVLLGRRSRLLPHLGECKAA